MKENKITVIIDKPIDEVFEFTTNPRNTHLWIPFISEEVTDEYPPRVNTKYSNCGEGGNWSEYKVVDFQQDKVFTLLNLNEDYFVQYTYRKLDGKKTELEYYEWVTEGKLNSPFTEDILGNLKKIMEVG